MSCHTTNHPRPTAALIRTRVSPSAATILLELRSLLEGINNKIKVIKRMAYGFRDDGYFFLKIRAAFPGIPG
jgi:hypothetical protein